MARGGLTRDAAGRLRDARGKFVARGGAKGGGASTRPPKTAKTSAATGDGVETFDRFKQIVAARLDAIKRGLLFSLWGKLVLATPVRFGVARGGWKGTRDEIDLRVPEKPTGASILPAPPPPEIAPSTNPNSVLWVTNNVLYVPFLNAGSSIQAPALFVEKAIAEVEAGFNQLVEQVVEADGGL